MTERATDNRPVMTILESMGYEFCFAGDRLDEQTWKAPDGRRGTYKFQKRRGSSGTHGRHLVGIAYRAFPTMDNFVFWADGEKYLIVIPSPRLKEIFDAEEGFRKIIRTQWHTNIYFDRGGLQILRPVRVVGGDDDEYDISEFGHAIPVGKER